MYLDHTFARKTFA